VCVLTAPQTKTSAKLTGIKIEYTSIEHGECENFLLDQHSNQPIRFEGLVYC